MAGWGAARAGLAVAAALAAGLAVGLAVGLTAAPARAASPPWGALPGWEGRYPVDADAKPPRNLFALPALQPTLRRMLGPQDRARLDAYAVQKPIQRVGDLLVAQECLPHDCGARNAMAVIDTAQPRVWVGFYERGANGVATRWYGTDDARELPAAVLALFDAQHTP